MWRGALAFLLFAFVLHASGNIYQTCGYSSGGNYYTLDALVKNMTDTPYSYQYNETHTLYYNICAGTSKCNGGMICLEGPTGHLTVYASAGDDVYASYGFEAMYMYYRPALGYISQTFDCSSSATSPLTITDVDVDDDDRSIYMYFNTPAICQPSQADITRTPMESNYLSGQIYMVGNMPMWAFDYVASQAYGQVAFDGHFYYSLPDLSFKLNGTLTNSKGQKSAVGMIVTGKRLLANPPISVAFFQPSSDKSTCALLPSLDDIDLMYWFDRSNNPESLVRSYESIYWDKGATFNVTEYFYSPYFTLMQRASDSVTVAIGQMFLAPFSDPWKNTFVSEVKWDSLSTKSLPSSTFEIPATCKQ